MIKIDMRFEVEFLDEAFEFLQGLERKHYEKILYNIRKVQEENDPELFKKLTDDIWEFRTLYRGLKYQKRFYHLRICFIKNRQKSIFIKLNNQFIFKT